MLPIITTRLLTKVGASLLRMARNLAKEAAAAKLLSKNQMINGFLLRATGRLSKAPDLAGTVEKASYVATVMDFPGFILFGGALSLPRYTSYGVSVPAGIRDDFDPPGTESQFEVMDKGNFFVQVLPTRRRPAAQAMATDWFPPIQQQDWFLSMSRLDAPVLKAFPDVTRWYLDDTDYFDYTCNVALTGGLGAFIAGARALTISEQGVTLGALTLNYFFRNQYSIDESDLPQDWKLYPRRLVPLDQSGTFFDQRMYPGVTMSGFAVIPASVLTTLEGIDLYCHAARTFRQHQEPWGESGSLEYDRYGEQGMLIAVGEQDRAQYNPATGANLFASTRRLRVIEPTDIEQDYLRPEPAMLPGSSISGRPELPNFGTFYTPTPVSVGGDFVVFSAYTTYRNLDTAASESELMAGEAWSILTTLPSGRTVSLRASWSATRGEIETGVPGEFMQPWIVGGASVPNQDGATAYCLVWEQTYTRGSLERIKGEWALYQSSGGSPSRSVIAGGAPLFALWMQDGPTQFKGVTWEIAETECGFSAIYHAGAGKLVTACTDYPPSPGARSIKCAIFDVQAKSVKIGGEITISNNYLDKCIVTVVQPFVRAENGRDAVPAVLLATITRHLVGNNGAGGKVFISVDGGDNWREYISDAGAQAGAFYVGNKLWRFDLNTGLDGRARQ